MGKRRSRSVQPTNKEIQQQENYSSSSLKGRKNGWSVDTTNLVKNWKMSINILAVMNYDAFEYYQWRGRLLGSFDTVMTAIIGGTGFALASANIDCDEMKVGNWITSAILMIVCGISVLNTFLNYGKQSLTHQNIYNQYQKLQDEIEIQLSLEEPSRQNGLEFERHVAVTLDHIRSTLQVKAPIPYKIRQRHLKLLETLPDNQKPSLLIRYTSPV